MSEVTCTSILLDKLHDWKLKNSGHPRRMTLSSDAHRSLQRELEPESDPKGEVKFFFAIPFEVDPKQRNPVVYH